MSALHRKLLRNLLTMKGQSMAIMVLIALGVATFVGSASAHRSLSQSRDTYFARYRFAHVFAEAVRVPHRIRSRLEAIVGVEQVQTRVATSGLITVDGFDEPVSARFVGLPDGTQPLLGRIHLRRGRLPEPGNPEAVVSEALATAHHLRPGDALTVLIKGQRRVLHISGIGLSPEHIYEVRPGDLFPDNLRFGILWVSESLLTELLGMTGAFNEVVIRLTRDAVEPPVLQAVDDLLRPFGGLGAYGRNRQMSARFVDEELEQLKGMAFFVPAVFMAVAMFLLHVIVGRMIETQREQIATLKALGYGNARIAAHYLSMVTVIVLLGSIAGCLLGYGYGSAMTGLYAEYYRFARFDYVFSLREPLFGTLGAVLAGTMGTLGAVRRAVQLQPAEAMRPASPLLYRPTLLERLGISDLLSIPGRMILRNLSRRPFRALASISGISAAVALLITGLFFGDAMTVIMDTQFRRAQRQDFTVTFAQPVSGDVVYDLMRLPGILSVEPMRSIPAVLRKGHLEYRTVLQGVPPTARLQRIISEDGHVLEIPEHGVMLSITLAHNLQVSVGDVVEAELLEGRRVLRTLPITAIADEPFGTTAWVSLETAQHLAGNTRDITSALLHVDSATEASLLQRLGTLPVIAAVSGRMAMLRSFEKMTQSVLLAFAGILSIFAGAMAMGVVYNAARISICERERELATLRVIGLTRGEISAILLGELLILILAALPLGCLLGLWLSILTAVASSTELYRIPVVILPRTWLFAVTVVGGSSILVALIARRRLDRLDLISVLKTRE